MKKCSKISNNLSNNMHFLKEAFFFIENLGSKIQSFKLSSWPAGYPLQLRNPQSLYVVQAILLKDYSICKEIL